MNIDFEKVKTVIDNLKKIRDISLADVETKLASQKAPSEFPAKDDYTKLVQKMNSIKSTLNQYITLINSDSGNLETADELSKNQSSSMSTKYDSYFSTSTASSINSNNRTSTNSSNISKMNEADLATVIKSKLDVSQKKATKIANAYMENLDDKKSFKTALKNMGYTAEEAKNYASMLYGDSEVKSSATTQVSLNSGSTSSNIKYSTNDKANVSLVSVALNEVTSKNNGGQKFYSWMGYSSHIDWCASFVSWCLAQDGKITQSLAKKNGFRESTKIWKYYKNQNRAFKRESGETPQVGDIIFFNWNYDTEDKFDLDHIGIVEKVENGKVYTIEGNSGDVVSRKSYKLTNKKIFGYARP